jgi:polyisoprenyl-teichoic acid--peptidoglycan teichoic acid transferase
MHNRHTPPPHIQSVTVVENYRFANPQNLYTAPKKSFVRRHWVFCTFLVLLAVFITGTSLAIGRFTSISDKIFVGNSKKGIFGAMQNLWKATTGNTTLVGEKENRISILLLGIGGEGHEGPYLTDSIVLVQIEPQTKHITLISIPRDYLLAAAPLPGRKINAAFAEGFASSNKNWNTAGTWAIQAVEKISGQTIPYFAVVDFAGFAKAIDEIGGVEVTIDTTFTDFTFPNNTNGYLPPVTFTKGTEHMDGKRALIFARSRHAAGTEGSDFARSSRQQKIVQAFKQQVVSKNIVTEPQTINKLLDVFANHFHTNLDPAELYRLYTLSKDLKKEDITSISLSPQTGLICDRILAETGAYVLAPCAGVSLADIAQFFDRAPLAARAIEEKSVVWLAYTPQSKTAANHITKTLQGIGATVYPIANYTATSVPNSTYAVSNKAPATTALLAKIYNLRQTLTPPAGVAINPEKTDIIITLSPSFQLPKSSIPATNPYSRFEFRTSSQTPLTSTTTPSSTPPTTATTTKATTTQTRIIKPTASPTANTSTPKKTKALP